MSNTKNEEKIIVPETMSETGDGVLYTGGEGTPAGTGAPEGTGTSGGVVTPSTGSTTVNPPMTATQYAELLRQQAITKAEDVRKQTIQASNIARQRSIADANSAYAKGTALYGQNAEKLASMGLQGGGYGEYLTSQAYQQNRSAVQNANAQHLAIEKEALYKEGQDKLAAESQYYSDMLGIQNDQTTAYNTLLSMANSGSTIESIMANNQWGLLSADQQAQVKIITQTNSYRKMIDNGTTLDEIKTNDPNYASLSEDAKLDLEAYYNTHVETKNNEAATAFSEISKMLMDGASLDDVKSLPGFALANEDQLATYKSIDAYNRALDAIAADDSITSLDQIDQAILADIKPADYTKLQGAANSIFKTRKDEASKKGTEYDNNINSAKVALLNGDKTFDEIQRETWYQNGLEDGSITQDDVDSLQKAANNRKNYDSIDSMIRAGSTWDEIENSDAFKGIDDDTIRSNIEQAWKDARDEAYDRLLDLADSGNVSINTIKEDEWFKNLSKSMQEDIEGTYEESQIPESAKKSISTYDMADLIRSGEYSLADLRNSTSYKTEYTDNQRGQLEEIAFAKIATNYSQARSETQLRNKLKSEGYSESDMIAIVKAWQNGHLDSLLNTDLSGYTVAEIQDMIDSGYIPKDAGLKLKSSNKIAYSNMDELEYAYKKGDINAEEFLKQQGEYVLDSKEMPRVNIADFSDGKRSGINEHFKITLGGEEYKLKTGSKVEDTTTENELNYLASGNVSTAPAEQSIVVYSGSAYIYTKNGWRPIKDRSGTDINEFLAALVLYKN